MTSKEIRQKYLDFLKTKGHVIVPSASLIPENDSSTLFTGSGMQPMVPYLLGEKHPEGTRIVDSQKCIRTGDIEEVGDTTHLTFFEMIGNWSLGDYFKKEQIVWIFEFWTKILGINPNRIYVSVYGGNDSIGIGKDEEAVNIWKEQFASAGINAVDIEDSENKGLQGGRIFYYGDANWWSRTGAPSTMPIGEPGGPDSEMFYDMGADKNIHENSRFKDQACHVNCDCGRFIEIGNNVFMEYVKTEKGFEKLPNRNVDFGGGLERIVMVVQEKDNVYETDLFTPIIEKIEELANKKYKESADIIKSMRIIAEHVRSASFLMGDDKGIVPSNTDQGYILRRLIRRAIRYGKKIGINKDIFLSDIARVIINEYKEAYPELEKNSEVIIDEFNKEEEKFSKTLERGLKEFEKLSDNDISGESVFLLYQSYGFPIEITKELAEEKNIKVDEAGFNKELMNHQELSRTASAGKFKGGLADASEETKKLHTTAHLLLAALRKVLGDHVVQKGSNITAERLRFDFSHPDKLSDEQKQEVERLVNEVIEKNLLVAQEEMPLEEAKKKGAMGVFDSKYDEKVKVYKVGEGADVFSYEICGGPHIENTGVLGRFKISKEQSSSAGVRRIKAILF